MKKSICTLTLLVIPLLTFAQNSVIEEILEGTVLITGLNSQGSGILVDSRGIVITNYHVIEDNLDLEVILPNGDSYSPNGVIAFDVEKDIALLKIAGFDLPSVDFGNSNSVTIGDDVLVTGAPQGMEQTLSRGIVSAIRDSGEGFTLFQTDAAISEGSSGGGMFSPEGVLIGVTVSSLTEGQNLNFVVPINYVRGLMGEEIAFTMDEFNALSPSIAASNLSNYSDSYDFLESYIAHLEDEYGDDGFTKIEDAWFLFGDEYTVYFQPLGDSSFMIGSMLDYNSADFSRDSLSRLLSASYAANFAKVGFDADGDVEVLSEISADNASFDSTSIVLNNIIELTDEAIEIAESNSRSDFSRSLNDTVNDNLVANRSYLNDTFEIFFDDSAWEQVESRTEAGGSYTSFASQTAAGVYMQIIEEPGLDVGYENLQVILELSAPDLEFVETGNLNVRGNSIWNGIANAEVDGIDFVFNILAYTGPGGTIQIQGWSFPSQAEVLREIINKTAQSVQIN
ncbi:MAG: trypsin-like peptidase domain-containing protein [Chloroflexota bacterium]|nr:trypsin-like peptidase domain-containing protein [Chloroflexota bacterium]